ncbi:MAG: hypothetical protein EA387_10580 [Nitriliruptor sp.]|nr:MAG: hypothetical protein EA387_10580 [Nitriliruptor sp.]
MASPRRLLATALALTLLVVACGGDRDVPVPPAEDTEVEQDPAEAPVPAPAPGTPQPEESAEPPPPPAPAPAPEPPAEPGELRAVWVHLFDSSLKSRAGIGQLVDELVAADATAVIAQVARRHDAYYRSEVLPATADPDLEPGLDVLEELTRAAHAAGLEVHAWISVAPTWHAVYEDLPAPDGWVPAEHGRRAPEADRWVSRTRDGGWTEYLDPALPEVRDHLAAIVTELATTTDVDGIHLDYLRYENQHSGYHPAALSRYRSETGAAGTPAVDDPRWSQWRRDQTRGLLDHARAALDATGQQVELSAAVITWGPGPSASGGFDATRTATEALQDWSAWVRDGAVDIVLPMNYFRSHVPEQAGWFRDWLAFEGRLAAEHPTRVVPGIGGWLNQPAGTLAQLGAALEGADGAAIYSYQQPAEGAAVDPEAPGVRPFWHELATSNWGADDDR